MKFGIIGTSKIAHASVQAAHKTGKFQLSAVYSRSLETAQAFGQAYGVSHYETDLKAFAASPDFDLVYIASPNRFHYEQVCLMLKAKKHVVVEKPAVVTLQQWQQVQYLAHQNGVWLFEAIRHAYEPNFALVADFLKGKKIDGAVLQFGQYSSRMPQLLAGEIPNIFNPKMSAGALMDLGVYTLHSALSWFGTPKAATYFPIKHSNGIDLQGDIVLNYEGFNVCIHISKRTHNVAKSEIYLGDATLLIDSVDQVKRVTLAREGQGEQILVDQYPQDRMQSQWELFAQALGRGEEAIRKAKAISKISGQVIELMQKLRFKNQILFEEDMNEIK